MTNPYSSDPQYQQGQESSLTARLTSWAAPLLASARKSLGSFLGQQPSNSLEPSATFSDRLSQATATSDSSPLLLAGLAAAGLGVATLLSSGLQLLSLGGGVGRAFGEVEEDGENSLGGVLADYNMQVGEEGGGRADLELTGHAVHAEDVLREVEEEEALDRPVSKHQDGGVLVCWKVMLT